MHALDNVIWQALTTRDAQFAESFGSAPVCTRGRTAWRFREHGGAGLRVSGRTGGTSRALWGYFSMMPYEARPGWEFVAGAPLLQMVCDNGSTPAQLNSTKDMPATRRAGHARFSRDD